MSAQDIRWIQRFNHFTQAFSQLRKAIDLTLVGGPDLTMKVLYRIMDEIDDLLLPYTFDLSIFNHISDPDVVDHIRRVGVPFYEKEEEQYN